MVPILDIHPTADLKKCHLGSGRERGGQRARFGARGQNGQIQLGMKTAVFSIIIEIEPTNKRGNLITRPTIMKIQSQ